MGKSLSAKHMCGSNSLRGSRFFSRKKMSNDQQPYSLHLDVKQWLKAMDLLQYSNLFANYKGVEEMLTLDEGDIKALGVINGAHRAKLMSSLVYLRKKYDKSNRRSKSNNKNPSLPPTGRKQASPNNKILCKHSPTAGSVSSLSQHLPMEPLVDPLASPQQLRQALEWELSLDGRDLRSHAWYHGTIPRQRAEELMAEDGDFLIRDCISQPGDYVLTCRWKEVCLHFVINKVVIQPNTVYERIQFQFEDDSYDTVPDLVTFYVGSGRPISVGSGAKISRPVNRSMPLTFYATKYGSQCLAAYGMIGGAGTPPLSIIGDSISPRPSPFQSPHHTPNCSPPTPRREIPPRLPDKQSRSSLAENRRFGMVVVEGQTETGSQTASSGDSVSTVASASKQHHLARVGSEPMLSPTLDRKRWTGPRLPYGTMCMSMTHNLDADDVDGGDKPPPKPSRVPSTIGRRPPPPTIRPKPPSVYYNEHGYEEPGGPRGLVSGGHVEYHNGSDSGNGSGDSVHSSDTSGSRDPGKRRKAESMSSGIGQVNPSNGPALPPRPGGRVPVLERRTEGDSAAEDEVVLLSLPEIDHPPCFDLSTFATMMLPKENKPLDGTALNCVHSLILDTGSRVLANHLTRVDVDILKSSGEHDLGLGVVSGIELVTLPQGRHLRKDLLERLECMKLFVAITILTSMNETQRAELVNKWIHVAIDTKTALGNLYGFTSIMLALGLPQIQRLKNTWFTLRQKYTESAFTYETKLRPTLKAMNEGVNPQAPNTSIPHLLPLLALLERPLGEDGGNANQSPTSASFLWEATSSDYGIQLIHTHLEAGRVFVSQGSTFRRNAEIVMENVKFDELVLDTFRTEFHLKFLWGTKGALVNSSERHAKFQQVLNVMSERCEAST